MGRSKTMLVALALGLIPGVALAGPGDEEWSYQPGGQPDEFRIGDVHGDAGSEIVLVVNGGVYEEPVVYHDGGIDLLDGQGNPIWRFETGEDFQGYPGVADIDGDGKDEVVACETSPEGMCYALDGDGSVIWSVGPYFWPSLWTMGPEIADVDMDGGLEVVIPTYGGTVAVIDAATGQTEWEYDAWDDAGELLYGSVAIGEIDGDSAPEIVLFGSKRGQVIALDGTTGAPDVVSESLYDSYGNASFGNTPVLEDIDNDGLDEIITTSIGWTEKAATFAIDGDGEVLWRQEALDQMVWLGPGVGDTNGDGVPEIFVSDAAGNLCRLDVDGNVAKIRTGDSSSWMEPVVTDVTGDLLPDVVGGSFTNVDVLDGESLEPAWEYEREGAGHWAPLLADVDRDGELELLTSGWLDSTLTAVDTGLEAGDPMTGGTLPLDLRSLAIAAENVAELASGDGAEDLEDAAEELWKMAEEALTEDPAKVFKGSKDVLEALEEAVEEGADAQHLIEHFVQMSHAFLERGVERALAIGDTESADEALAGWAAVTQALESGDMKDVGEAIEDAFKPLGDIDYAFSDCPPSPGHTRLARLCTVLETRALAEDVVADPDTSGKVAEHMEDAIEEMEKTAEELAVGDRKEAASKAKEAAKDLQKALEEGGDSGAIGIMLDELYAVIEAEALAALSDAKLIYGENSKEMEKALEELDESHQELVAGDYEKAIDKLKHVIEAL